MLIEISKTVRIEDAPPRKREVATKELLDDRVTASHYQAPRPATEDEIADPAVLTEGKQRKFMDAMGKPIELGKEMDFIDWKCSAEQRVWNVYELREIEEQDADGNPITVDRYICAGTYPTMEEANAFALTL